LPKINVLGHSHGGAIAIGYAIRYPGHVLKLIWWIRAFKVSRAPTLRSGRWRREKATRAGDGGIVGAQHAAVLFRSRQKHGGLRIHAEIPHSQLKILDKTGHFPWAEDAAPDFFAAIENFMRWREARRRLWITRDPRTGEIRQVVGYFYWGHQYAKK
jgi:pimeloyl-ACP methyl ester carboxylesterase